MPMIRPTLFALTFCVCGTVLTEGQEIGSLTAQERRSWDKGGLYERDEEGGGGNAEKHSG